MTDVVTFGEALRIVLILLIFGSAGGALRLLVADWHRIEPRYWRPIVTAFHAVLVANALAVGVALTRDIAITVATWGLVASYAVLAVVVTIAPYSERVQRH